MVLRRLESGCACMQRRLTGCCVDANCLLADLQGVARVLAALDTASAHLSTHWLLMCLAASNIIIQFSSSSAPSHFLSPIRPLPPVLLSWATLSQEVAPLLGQSRTTASVLQFRSLMMLQESASGCCCLADADIRMLTADGIF